MVQKYKPYLKKRKKTEKNNDYFTIQKQSKLG
jgi:hypothetical protein